MSNRVNFALHYGCFMTWLHDVTLLIKTSNTSNESVELAEKWVYHFDNYSFTCIINDMNLVFETIKYVTTNSN